MSAEFKIDWEKSVAAVLYLAASGIPELSRYKMAKLLFLADKYHLVKYGRTITGDTYYALDYGPIPSEILRAMKALERNEESRLTDVLSLDRTFTYPRISAKVSFNVEDLSESDILSLNRTIELFGQMGFAELKALTHEMPAYTKAWDRRGSGRSALMAFEEFFEEDEEAIAGVQEDMLENDILDRVFRTI